MRTTLNLDADILEAARSLAEQRGLPVGTIISELARRSLTAHPPADSRNGIRLFPVRRDAREVTPELVKELLEETD